MPPRRLAAWLEERAPTGRPHGSPTPRGSRPPPTTSPGPPWSGGRGRSTGRWPQTYPDAHIELDFRTPLELLVATILSAQSTDKRVNLVTPMLFARYPDAAAYAAADRAELEALITPTGFFRAKTDSLIKLGAALTERFDGEVPRTLDELVTLPGVGRKTANVVLGNAFGVPGITVDTHFGRLARRFGWTTELDPEKVEARGRRAVPAQGLDPAVPQRDLARPPSLPRPQPRLRRLPGRPLVPCVRRRGDRSGQGRQAGPRAARMMHPQAAALSCWPGHAAGRMRRATRRESLARRDSQQQHWARGARPAAQRETWRR